MFQQAGQVLNMRDLQAPKHHENQVFITFMVSNQGDVWYYAQDVMYTFMCVIHELVMYPIVT